ncbi:GH25 family lysozyme, partial [Megamonas sp.]|uniref:GH25 family lysozyme n=1 Tax=Megamonas sp. TaxID=2049033 RepID=UPI00258966FD
SLIDEAITEANWVDKQIKTYLNGKNPELGIWYDAEDEDMLEGHLNVVYPIANFISILLSKGYNYVGLYSSYNWLTNVIDLKALPDYVPIWSAQYGYHENSFAIENPSRICRIWQYTDCEQIGNMQLDCNIYYE